MQDTTIQFSANGVPISALLRRPDTEAPHPAVVQGPGWLGLKDAKLYEPYHRALTDAGIAILIIDYRGFGDSGGDPSSILVSDQVDDLVQAVTYLCGRSDIDETRIGVFGSGGTGGGNAIVLAARDRRIKCAVAQVPIADGEEWLRRMRAAQEWEAFRQKVKASGQRNAQDGRVEMVDPRTEITIPTAERKNTTVKQDVDGRVPRLVSLQLAEDLFNYRPIDFVSQVSRLMIVAVDGDDVTPTEHAVALFKKAASPKRMVLQRGTTHYSAYQQYGAEVIPRIVGWFQNYLTPHNTGTSAQDFNDVEIVGADQNENPVEL